jgi:hypothetical protein
MEICVEQKKRNVLEVFHEGESSTKVDPTPHQQALIQQHEVWFARAKESQGLCWLLRISHGLHNELTILSESASKAMVFTRSFRPRSCRANTTREPLLSNSPESLSAFRYRFKKGTLYSLAHCTYHRVTNEGEKT